VACCGGAFITHMHANQRPGFGKARSSTVGRRERWTVRDDEA